MFSKSNKSIVYGGIAVILAIVVLMSPVGQSLRKNPTKTPRPSATSLTKLPQTPVSEPTPTDVIPTSTSTLAPTLEPTSTPTLVATATPVLTPTQPPTGNIAPYPSAPACPDIGSAHNTSEWHSLWDSVRGCHYDHEHGQDPFTPEVEDAFPGFNLRELLGGVEISHTNPSSPMENTHKHGGHKWQVDVSVPNECSTAFESGANPPNSYGVKSYAIQFHVFGREDVEHEARNHSTAVLLAFCKPGSPNDVGYMYVPQLQEYGQRVAPYQGFIMDYPDLFRDPITQEIFKWDSRRGQYFNAGCFGNDVTMPASAAGRTDVATIFVDCRPTFSDSNNNDSIWTSKITGTRNPSLQRPPGSNLFQLLFRKRDGYQRFDITDLTHPFTWRFVCGGVNYNPVGCRFNNSTNTIHEIKGFIPASWDNKPGFDTNPVVGRITANGFVDRFGTLLPVSECTQAGGNCHPIKLVNMFVGQYSAEISEEKVSNPNPTNTPEKDIYFCNGVVCSEINPSNPNQVNPAAVPSGWLGSEN